MVKSTITYILDTSVLIDNPHIIKNELIGDNIIIPLSVVRELDGLKNSLNSSQARQAREALRNIRYLLLDQTEEITPHSIEDNIIDITSLKNKAEREHGGYLHIEFNHNTIQQTDPLYEKFNIETNDDRIIAVAYNYTHEEDKVVLLTKDTAMAIIATSLGVSSHLYTSSSDNFHPGTGLKQYYSIGDEVQKL